MLSPVVKEVDIKNDFFDWVKEKTYEVVNDDINYPKKIRSKNFYKKLSPELLSVIKDLMTKQEEASSLTWHFEIFYSQDPVGPHNDRNFFLDRKERCDRGMIFPISWTGQAPKTRFFDLIIENKVNWDGEGFSTLEKEKIDYDKSAMEKFKDLSWKTKNFIFFDSRQIHEATPFTTKESDYKLSINGLGYSNI